MVEKPDDDLSLDERIAHVRTLVRECTELTDDLDMALSRAERVVTPERVVTFWGT